jgi:hypothetical protein
MRASRDASLRPIVSADTIESHEREQCGTSKAFRNGWYFALPAILRWTGTLAGSMMTALIWMHAAVQILCVVARLASW